MKKRYLAVCTTSVFVRFKGIFTIVLGTVLQHFTPRYDYALMTREQKFCEHGTTATTVCMRRVLIQEICRYTTMTFVFNFVKLLAIKRSRKFGNTCRPASPEEESAASENRL